MSIFRDHNFGYNDTKAQEERWAELRRKASNNLSDIRAGKFRKEKELKAQERQTELQKARAWEIQLGHDVLERRELMKPLNRLLRKNQMTPEELGAAEELQSMVDKYDENLRDYTRQELSRFVRLWNKSRKERYKL